MLQALPRHPRLNRGLVRSAPPLPPCNTTKPVSRSPQPFAPAQGAANLVGVTWLSSLLADAGTKAALAASSLGFVAGAMPFLQVSFLFHCLIVIVINIIFIL